MELRIGGAVGCNSLQDNRICSYAGQTQVLYLKLMRCQSLRTYPSLSEVSHFKQLVYSIHFGLFIEPW
jgi:hypothetical protein